MAINKAGMDSTGFRVPTYEEILDQIEQQFQEKWQNPALTPNSQFGMLARQMAFGFSELWQSVQDVFYSGFIATASGTALDRLGANVGIPRKVARPAKGEITVTTDGEYLLQAGETFETEDGNVYDLTDDLMTTQQKDGSFVGTGEIQAQETGRFGNVLAHSVTVIGNPDENVLSVDNPESLEGGQDQETDSDYRRRLLIENNANPSATVNGIKSALLDVDGVTQVNLVSNSTDKADEYGNPAYTMHVYVLGGVKEDIAKALAKYTGFGPVFVGTQAVDVADMTGQIHTYHFDYALEVPVYVNIDLKTNSNFNQDSVDTIKQNIVDYIDSLEMGDKLVLTRLYEPVYQIDGVVEASITAGQSQDSLNQDDIAVKPLESVKCQLDNVKVNVGV